MNEISHNLKRIANLSECTNIGTNHIKDDWIYLRKVFFDIVENEMSSNEQFYNVLIDIFSALRNQAAFVARDKALTETFLACLEVDQHVMLTKIVATLSGSVQKLFDELSNNNNSNGIEVANLIVVYRILQAIFNLSNLNNDSCGSTQSTFSCLFDFQHLRFVLTLHSFDAKSDEVGQYFRKISVVFSAVLHNCLKKKNELQSQIFANPLKRQAELWFPLLDHVLLEISEWSLWIIFLAFKHESFSQVLLCNEAFQDRQMLILDILIEFIDEECSLGTSTSKVSFDSPTSLDGLVKLEKTFLSYSFVSYMIENFKKDMNFALNYGNEDVTSSEQNKILKICKFSLINLKLSSLELYKATFQQDTELFELLVKVLKNLQILARTNPNSVFGVQSQLKDVELDEKGDVPNPLFGFKRNVIGIIANILYRNSTAQNYLRDSEGLVALLDCAKIDNRNPFILQWSIFALRNALENNSANQELVSQLKMTKIVKDELIDQIHK